MTISMCRNPRFYKVSIGVEVTVQRERACFAHQTWVDSWHLSWSQAPLRIITLSMVRCGPETQEQEGAKLSKLSKEVAARLFKIYVPWHWIPYECVAAPRNHMGVWSRHKDKATGSWHCIQSPRNQESARIEGTHLAEQTLVLSLTPYMDPMLHWARPYTLKQPR